MTIDTALRSYLMGDAAIAALVVGRVYPLRLPQPKTGRTELPAITYTRISTVRHGQLRGRASLARPRFQVDAWAYKPDDAAALGALCRERLEGFVGDWLDEDTSPAAPIKVAIEFDSERDFFEEDILGGLSRRSADYFLWHQTAGGTI